MSTFLSERGRENRSSGYTKRSQLKPNLIPVKQISYCQQAKYVRTSSLKATTERFGVNMTKANLQNNGNSFRAAPASLRCGPLARHIYPSLVLV